MKPIKAIIDGPSDSTPIVAEDGRTTVQISAASWDPGTSVALEGKTKSGSHWCPVKADTGIDVVATSNTLVIVDGSGLLRMNVSGIGTTTGLELSLDD